MDIDGHRQAVGLFRYSLIRPLAEEGLGARERGALVRAAASVDHVGPDGARVEVSATSMRRWLRAWRAGGFAGLVPAVRAQPTRTPAEILDRAVVLKREAPGRTAAQVARALAEAGEGVVSARTLQRHFARAGLNRSPDGSPPPRPFHSRGQSAVTCGVGSRLARPTAAMLCVVGARCVVRRAERRPDRCWGR